MHPSMRASVSLCVYAFVHVSACICTCMRLCMCLHASVRICVCACVFMHLYIIYIMCSAGPEVDWYGPEHIQYIGKGGGGGVARL